MTITQRLVLSTVSSIFDPIGLIAPFTIRARLLLKQLWKSTGQQWDEEIPKDSQSQFLEWCSELENISKIAVPRAFFSKPNGQYELHVFGDASAEAFAAVAYLRQPDSKGDETSQTAFIIGKARVAPMKLLTIPKLEFQAALLASRLKRFVEDSLTIPINKVNLWTDSTTVCQWIRSSASKHPIFVANRLSEILELTSVDQWKFVPGSRNPADCSTRGFPANRLNNCSWIHGPSFLKEEFTFSATLLKGVTIPYGDNSYQATTHIKRQLISCDNSYQATTHIMRQIISSDNSYQATTHINSIKPQLLSSDRSYQSGKSDNSFQVCL